MPSNSVFGLIGEAISGRNIPLRLVSYSVNDLDYTKTS
jgi:hypothetical protein